MAPTVETAEQNRTSLLRSLRRVTTSGRYIPEIDGLRFVAILSVILYHVTVQLGIPAAGSYWLWYLISHGARGVELFFLISGFILGLPFATHLLTAGRPVRLRDYFLRRVTRLEPPYILAILVRIPLLILIMHKPFHFVLTHGLASLFYLHSLIFGAASAVNPPAWSLEVEIQFYCLAPILAWSYFRLRPKSLRRLLGLTFILLCGLLQVHYLFDAVLSAALAEHPELRTVLLRRFLSVRPVPRGLGSHSFSLALGSCLAAGVGLDLPRRGLESSRVFALRDPRRLSGRLQRLSLPVILSRRMGQSHRRHVLQHLPHS